MTLIKSISGIRGTIGGKPGDNLSPLDVVKFTAAYGTWLSQTAAAKEEHIKHTVVVGRDARLSGEMVQNLVIGTLQSVGLSVLDIGMATTPTVEMAVAFENALGGIILTASHNPRQWNALKLLNHKGEFISKADGQTILDIAATETFNFVEVDDLGQVSQSNHFLQRHIDAILALDLVDVAAIKKANFKIAIDAVNSVGGIAIPELLCQLGVDDQDIVPLYCEPTGDFPHNPEPLPQHLSAICNEVKRSGASLGIVVDPDVDRLAFVCEDGHLFGEEYTLVAIADYVLQHQKGATVSNLSSTKALRELTEKMGLRHEASAVGEVNVVEKMKEIQAVIGGEGNGGVIYPALHYGRDALVGIALFLSYLAKFGQSCAMLRDQYPDYVISKNKIALTPDMDVDDILVKLQKKYDDYPIDSTDGIKIHIDGDWVQLRKSNTEPIIRVYSESNTKTTADNLADKIKMDIRNIIRG